MSKSEQATLDTGRVKQVPRDYDGQLGNGKDIPTVIESDGDEERCPYCGDWYSRISTHWSHPNSNCAHPPISEHKIEILKGLLLGDGSIAGRRYKNCQISIGNINKTFLKWLKNELDWLSNKVGISQSNVETALRVRENLGRSTTHRDTCDYYMMKTKSHNELNKFEEWYETGELIFPQLDLSVEALKMWYVSDGYLNFSGVGDAFVTIVSQNESDRPNAVLDMLEDLGFTVGHSGINFHLSTEDTEDFFDLIGKAPPGFEYKWAYEDRDRYNRLKEECREKHCTQTLK